MPSQKSLNKFVASEPTSQKGQPKDWLLAWFKNKLRWYPQQPHRFIFYKSFWSVLGSQALETPQQGFRALNGRRSCWTWLGSAPKPPRPSPEPSPEPSPAFSGTFSGTSLNLTRRLHQCTPELFGAEDPISLRCWGVWKWGTPNFDGSSSCEHKRMPQICPERHDLISSLLQLSGSDRIPTWSFCTPTAWDPKGPEIPASIRKSAWLALSFDNKHSCASFWRFARLSCSSSVFLPSSCRLPLRSDRRHAPPCWTRASEKRVAEGADKGRVYRVYLIFGQT